MINAEANEHVAEFVRGKIDAVVTDPVVAEKLKPRGYPIFARRPCLDSSYYETYNRPNVHWVDSLGDPIVEITERGVRTQSGEPWRAVLVSRDVTELQENREQLEVATLAFENMAEAIMVTAADGRIVSEIVKAKLG